MENFNMEEYSKIVLFIANLCQVEQKKNPKTFKKLHIWYLYKQAFYGFMDHLDWSKCCRVSERAQVEYKKIRPAGDIRTMKWADQPSFDSGRQNGKFHFEHVFTGDMFRDAVERLSLHERTSEMIAKIIRDNFCVAWILKEENKLIPLSRRGKSLEDALLVYERCGIKLLPA